MAKSLQARVGILCGSPGVGKTFCVAELASEIIKHFGQNQVAAMCPTGKAAVRITESFFNSGIRLRARTIHSYLMKYGPDCPLPYKFILLDEASMVDTDTAAGLMCACPKDTHVLWTGDPNQLPPVGHGAPLRDLIAAGLPYGELREIKRNSGGIVEACAAIRDSKPWEPGDNLKVFEHAEPEFQVKRLVQLLGAARGEGFDPVWDCQVLVPVNKKSPLSRRDLNKLLQGELNQNPVVQGSPFRLGDKVCNTKNGYFTAVDADFTDEDTATNERGEVYVANGELGEVIEVAEKFVVVKLSSPARVVRVPRGKAADADSESDLAGADGSGADDGPATGCSWDLGYALSVHKFQGSEVGVAIIMIDDYPGAKMVCDRAWIYTAISRAKKHCLLIGRKSTADRFCRVNRIANRKTMLREQILLANAKRELADL